MSAARDTSCQDITLPLGIAVEKHVNNSLIAPLEDASNILDVYDLYQLSLVSKSLLEVAMRVASSMRVFDSTRWRFRGYDCTWVPLAPVKRCCPHVRELRCTKFQLPWCLTRDFQSSEDAEVFPPGLKVLYVDATRCTAELNEDEHDARSIVLSRHRYQLRMRLPDGLQEFYWHNDPWKQILPRELPSTLRVLDCLPGYFQMPSSEFPSKLRVLRVRHIRDADAFDVTSAAQETLDKARRLPHLEVCEVLN
ncbi:MAG: hypothetical protein ABEI52_08265 [Halobacteriaceae archaeon]